MLQNKNKMYVVAVDMGYGHQRAAQPLLSLAEGGIINANRYKGISKKEERQWSGGRKWYEIISRFKDVSFLGKIAFSIMDSFQKIEKFYPRRDLSKNSSQQDWFYNQVKGGLGKRLIDELNKNPLPFVTSFFVPAYFAEYWGYKDDIYCIVCDADVARAWAPHTPKESRIKYLVPNKRVKERLMLYGVKKENIYITGFPLPKENIGGESLKTIKFDLKARLYNLDPRGAYRKKYHKLIEDYVCPVKDIKKNNHPLTVTFAVGGAGAQREVGATILRKMKKQILTGKFRLNLVAGNRNDVYLFYRDVLIKNKLEKNKNINIIYNNDKFEYFKDFNLALRTTDVLWTKPSELTFFSGLGLPIIISNPVGSQEEYNKDWLTYIGAGVNSLDPEYVDEWLMDWLESGWLAEAAMNGFLNAPKLGAYHIEDIVLKKKIVEANEIHLL